MSNGVVESATNQALIILTGIGVRVQEGLWRETLRWSAAAARGMVLAPWMVTRQYLNLLGDRADEIGRAQL